MLDISVWLQKVYLKPSQTNQNHLKTILSYGHYLNINKTVLVIKTVFPGYGEQCLNPCPDEEVFKGHWDVLQPNYVCTQFRV